jgi:aldehyde reductase
MSILFLDNAVLLQVECNPYLTQKKLISFCKSRGITVTGYSPMGSPDSPYFKVGMPRLLEDPKLKEVAQLYGKSVGQVVLRYLVIDTGLVLAVQPF